MKILQIVHGLPCDSAGGTEVYTYGLTYELAKKHEVFIFHRDNNPKIKEYEIKYEKERGLTTFSINNTFRAYNNFVDTYKNTALAEKFSQILDQINPDIVHIQSLLYLGATLVEEIKKRGIPVVFTLHDYWLLCPQGQLLKNNRIICDKNNGADCAECVAYQINIKKGLADVFFFLQKNTPRFLVNLGRNIYLNHSKYISAKRTSAARKLEKRREYLRGICEKIDLFISPSKFLKERFIEFGIPADKIMQISYGLDLGKFKGLSKSGSEKLRFGFIGNLMPAKGAHLLIESFNKINNKNAELKIYGKEISYKGALFDYSNQVKKLARNQNIKFLGGFKNEDIANIFKEIDILVVPSIWQENLPLVIQEALAASTPVLATDIGGIKELVTDGINGILFKAGSADDLYIKISSIIEKPSILEDLRENIALPKSIEEHCKEIEDIYEGLLSPAKNS